MEKCFFVFEVTQMSCEYCCQLAHDRWNVLNSLVLCFCIHHWKDMIEGRIYLKIVELGNSINRFRRVHYCRCSFWYNSFLMTINHFLELFLLFFIVLINNFFLKHISRFLSDSLCLLYWIFLNICRIIRHTTMNDILYFIFMIFLKIKYRILDILLWMISCTLFLCFY